MKLKERLKQYEVKPKENEAHKVTADIDTFMEARKDYLELTGIPTYIIKLVLHNFLVYLKHERS